MDQPIVLKWKINYNLSFYFAGTKEVAVLWVTDPHLAVWLDEDEATKMRDVVFLLEPHVILELTRLENL